MAGQPMRLGDIITRSQPLPWSEGDNIPWNDPDFSNRMLIEHLTQEHDAASRRFERIDRHVSWIHTALLHQRPARVLDLGCGPGLYAARLAALGHSCTGIDYSPASIAYAREHARIEQLDCTYRREDIRSAAFGAVYDLAMLIYGEVNVFPPAVVGDILARACAALKPGGILLLEPSTAEAIRRLGAEAPSWSAVASGLFLATPHIVLEEHLWHDEQRAATVRYFVIDAANGAVTRHAASYQAYEFDELRALLEAAGFDQICMFASLTGEPDGTERDFCAFTAARKEQVQ